MLPPLREGGTPHRARRRGQCLARGLRHGRRDAFARPVRVTARQARLDALAPPAGNAAGRRGIPRSEEHTSELQSLMRISYAVFCLKKKTKHLLIVYNILFINVYRPQTHTI